MKAASLIVWIVTAAGGAVILLVWFLRGGARRPQDHAEQEARHPTASGRAPLGLTVHLLVPHVVLALVGLILWSAFVAASEDYGIARVVAPIVIGVVAVLGLLMFRRWTHAVRSASADTVPERAIPSTLVKVHGLAALAAVVLVVIAAILG
jgi:hypothetical protein